MTIHANTKTTVKTSSSAATSSTSRGLVIASGFAAAVVGLWAAACFVGAVMSNGPIGIIRGWFSAVSGL